MSKPSLLDASALLALVQNEPGADVVEAYLTEACMCAVNASEAIAKLLLRGADSGKVTRFLEASEIPLLPFDEDLAYRAAYLVDRTRQRGVSFADRACIALAQRENLPIVTADKQWASLDLDVELILIR